MRSYLARIVSVVVLALFSAVAVQGGNPAVGHFNGDGRADLLARDSAGILWLYPRGSATAWMPRVQVGQGWNVMSTVV
ncbi:hypothetical protein StoSoilB20_09240 [Arthrobacter sp. StoSoilB20]|nr:hypothetical protein StoSoilB20_09240 [Arthrobacter sp. StoSoilB20]